jgi:dTDP-4-amino-4,6-dideoxygalactose transaminase
VAAARRALARAFEREVLALVDSGTSALSLAIRVAVGPEGGRVAIPAYGCIDVPTAVMGAGARAVPYDLDPLTLAPDMASLEAALARGARAIIVSHLFGHPVDLTELRSRCDARGVTLIEDAAQWAGGRLRGRPLGSFGHLSVLSLGRGKGLVGTGGGVLLGEHGALSAADVDVLRRMGGGGDPAATWRAAASAFAAIALGRPTLYSIPASIPALRLGEMVFHPVHAVGPMSRLSVELLPSALAEIDAERERRRAVAERLSDAARAGGMAQIPAAPPDSHPGYLRLPVIVGTASELPADLGVLRPYQRPLSAQPEVASVVESAPTVRSVGADLLASGLATLPVHRHVSSDDERRLVRWLSQGVRTERPPS